MADNRYPIQHLPIDDVFVVGNRRRSMQEQSVERLAESISTIGLQTPITVRVDDTIPDPETGEVLGGYAVVTGAHRLEVCRRLGHTEIPAIVRDCDEIDAELWEIDENLCRAELTEAEQAQQLARRKELWERREQRDEEESGTSCPTLIGRGHKGFAADTAASTGQSKRDINRKVSRGEKIAPDVFDEITGSKWDRGVVLDVLKRLNHDEQRQALQRVHSGASVSFQDAYNFIRGEPSAPRVVEIHHEKDWSEIEDDLFNRLMKIWNQCPPSVRRRFFDSVEEPAVMEKWA